MRERSVRAGRESRSRAAAGPRPRGAGNALALLLGAALLAACASAAPDPALEQVAAAMRWESPLGRDHVLAGRIWAMDDGRFITPAQLVRRLTRARFSLLG